jgi:hypothetical protein
MINRIIRKIPYGGEVTVFVNDENEREYRRMVGGLAWPHGEKPGYAIVVAEAYVEDPQLKDRPIWVIREIEESDILNLLRYCQELHEPFKVQDWYGNTSDKAMMANFYHINRGSAERNRFAFKTAPYANEPNGLAFYMPIIKKHLAVNRKILHFGEGSKLPGILAQVGPGDMLKNPAELPPIAALGYTLTYLERYKPEPSRAKKTNRGSAWAV